MSTRRHSLWPAWVGVGLLAALAALWYLRAKAPPEAARLLPESDAIVYANLRPLRGLTASGFPGEGGHGRSPGRDLRAFIDATGIVPERDLDSAAFALHRMADPRGPNGAVAYSEVFVGHFDAGRLRAYLARLAHGTEEYADRVIYSIPVEGRTLRVAIVAYDIVAASNMPSTEQIHSMLDRSRASALWQPGSSLLGARFGEVPLLAQAWAIGRIGLPFRRRGGVSVMGLDLPVPVDSELVASLRYSGDVHLRVEEIAPDTLAAQHTAESVGNILSVLRGLASPDGPHSARDAAIRAVLSSARVSQKAERASLTASASVEQIRQLSSAAAAPSLAEHEGPTAATSSPNP